MKEILNAGAYHPWKDRKNSVFDEHSRQILDLKKNRDTSIEYFFNMIVDKMPSNIEAIVVVPSHNPKEPSGSLQDLATKLSAHHGWENRNVCLSRYKLIDKLSEGGDRSLETHRLSISVKSCQVFGRSVLLLDDVTTTGNSLRACYDILLRAGATHVTMFALAATSSQQ
jgi:predicted amidophosphoribosyltransferase